MKKLLTSLGVGLLMLGIGSAATPDTQLFDHLPSTTPVQNLKFTQLKSCESLEQMLEKYAKNVSAYTKRAGGAMNLMVEDAVIEVAEMTTAKSDALSSSSTDFSQTNIQKS
ncbi:MAG: hypothetical protein Q4B28_07110 [bacterium]|nr:hypothetical protein [bacterium]